MDGNIKIQTTRCPFCLATNPLTAIKCSTCGKSLTEAVKSNPVMADSKVNNNVKFEGDISNTITGLLLLGIGTSIIWITFAILPYVEYLGILLNLIGVILIFLNRHSFESKHSTFVILSIVIYAFSAIISGAITLIGAFSIVTSSITSQNLSQQETFVRSMLQTRIIGTMIAGVLASIAYLTITYGLQDAKGKLVLYIGFVLNLIVEAILGSILYGALITILSHMSSTGSYKPSELNSFNNALEIYSLLAVLPSVFYAIAYLRIRSIIRKEAGYGKSDDSAPA